MGTKTPAKTAGMIIRDRRLNPDKPLKQRELASKLGVDPITISRWERGTTGPSDIHRVLLAKALGGHPDEYLKRDEVAA